MTCRTWYPSILNFALPLADDGHIVTYDDNATLADRLIEAHKATARVPYEYETDDFSDEIRIYTVRNGKRRTLINLQLESVS